MSTPRCVTLPQGVDRRVIRARDHQFALLEARPQEGVPTLGAALFVPGFTGSKEDFVAILPLLASQGFHAVAYDQRGQYETPGTDRAEDYSVSQLAQDTSAVAAALWESSPIHLVGHSLGGLIARQAAVFSPQRYQSLTLMSSGPKRVPDHQVSQLETLQQLLPTLDLESIWRAKEALDEANGIELPPAEIQRFLHLRWVNNHPLGLHQKADILLREPDRTAEVTSAGVPVTVMMGKNDDVWWPVIQQRMAQALDAHALVCLADVGHSPAVEAPERTTTHLIHSWMSRFTTTVRGYDKDVEKVMTHCTTAAQARQACDVFLRQHRLSRLQDDAELVVSELVANSVKHAALPADVTMETRPGVVRISVHDTSGELPLVRQPSPDQPSGRGMGIVNTLADDWGAYRTTDGKVVWADLPIYP